MRKFFVPFTSIAADTKPFLDTGEWLTAVSTQDRKLAMTEIQEETLPEPDFLKLYPAFLRRQSGKTVKGAFQYWKYKKG